MQMVAVYSLFLLGLGIGTVAHLPAAISAALGGAIAAVLSGFWYHERHNGQCDEGA
ncbi:hypothetical protein J7I98_28345 [Streptomyces sp. ISL-98]|uniref:hypothetical protein n=1 Tax=Streptomyces sp. ISL-98 TaxID=2819192 RepID=UPI001BE83C88|nr:hypothetical protein [Streptomyces sp. ISL-98]MBT2509715.1 hypothetical protein [Streptomyces sp. ISL-98]